jgi:hypothetical protein
MAQKRKDPEVGQDILRKYLVGGTWKRRILDKLGKGRSERTKLSRSYVAIPPEGGWPGGLPEQNGYKAGGKK